MMAAKTGFTDAQREILECEFMNGLISTSDKFQERFNSVAERTGLSIYKIKIWVNNRKRRDRKRKLPEGQEEGEEVLGERNNDSGPKTLEYFHSGKTVRKVSGHNVFCGTLWSGGRTRIRISSFVVLQVVGYSCRYSRIG